jgi:TetR/AcrR family transcriptional repressor of nem operon
MPWEKNFDVGEALDRAMHLFWERGYEATTMQELVDYTGVNRGSLYATYTDKHALFIAALRRYDETMRRTLLARLERQYAPKESIRQLFMAFISAASGDGINRGCFMTNTALELAARDAAVRKIVARAQEETEAFFAKAIKMAKEQGEVPAHVKPAEEARSLLASLLGVLVLTRCRPDRGLLIAIVNDTIRRLE